MTAAPAIIDSPAEDTPKVISAQDTAKWQIHDYVSEESTCKLTIAGIKYSNVPYQYKVHEVSVHELLVMIEPQVRIRILQDTLRREFATPDNKALLPGIKRAEVEERLRQLQVIDIRKTLDSTRTRARMSDVQRYFHQPAQRAKIREEHADDWEDFKEKVTAYKESLEDSLFDE